MSDISELVGRLRGPVKHPQQSVSLRLEAADALETLAGENVELRDLADRGSKEAWECAKLAKQIAPVVEAARQLLGNIHYSALAESNAALHAKELYDALATLEAAHD